MIKISSNDNKQELQHIAYHLNKLSELYEDVHMEYRGISPTYSCAHINSLADDVDFSYQTIGVYCNFKLVSPFRKTYIPCDQCDGGIKMYTEPFNIPIYVIPEEAKYNADYVAQFLTFSYEDVLRRMEVQPSVYAKIRETILADIDTIQKGKKKTSTDFLNASVKNLLIFT